MVAGGKHHTVPGAAAVSYRVHRARPRTVRLCTLQPFAVRVSLEAPFRNAMNETDYHEFERLHAQGRKEEARTALNRFIASFAPEDDRRAWVRTYLERGDWRHTIRHELYERVIFPELVEGYRRGDLWSTLWLAKTAQNLYRAPALWESIDYVSELQLLARAYTLDPEHDEIRQHLLAALLKWFRYCQHEWPTGILYGTDGATPAQCAEILDDIRLARSLDSAGKHEPFLQEFEARTREHQQRLAALGIE